MNDPYPVSLATVQTVWSARPDQLRSILERFGYVQVDGGPFRDPLFRDERWDRTLTLEEIEGQARSNPGLRYDLYQAWMDISRQGY
jgi:hypothetical protein